MKGDNDAARIIEGQSVRINFDFAKRSLSHMRPYFSLVDDHCLFPVHEDTSVLTCHWPGRIISFARGYFNSVLFLPSLNLDLLPETQLLSNDVPTLLQQEGRLQNVDVPPLPRSPKALSSPPAYPTMWRTLGQDC